ncbi:MAG: MFS transporter [Acetobacteraceae bacterium SCN 69-10]|nr:MAG: MFS transporter [Acetobacteraceae bacterium SCN 69-10]OJY73170.1 MAG: MFS transporter [Rhodospirillales bacterium 70-18]
MAAPPGGRPASIRLTALIIASALFMEGIDSTVLATALPTMAHSFGVDPLQMNVALTSYLLSLAVCLPASGRAADRFGARNVFRAAIGMFTLGSVLCAQADSLTFLVVARVVQGIGGAMMTPVGRLVLLKTVSKSELVSAMAWLLIPATAGPILGPPLGGFIVTYLSWRWIFYINVPFGLLGIVLVSLFIREVREPEPAPFDVTGLLLSGVTLFCLMAALEAAGRGIGSGGLAVGLFAAAVAGGALYWRHARTQAQPVLDFGLMRIPTFRISVLSGSLSRIAVGAVPFLLPMMLQVGFGDSAARSGGITFAGSIGALFMRPFAPRLLRRIGFRNTLIWVGLASTALLATSAAFRPSWPVPAIFGVLVVIGFVQSLQFMGYNTIAYADVPRARMSAATSFYTTIQQLCLTLGIGVSAAALAASVALNGHARAMPGDFSAAYLFVACVAIFAPLVATRLDPMAGAELSGQTAAAVQAPLRMRVGASLRLLRRRVAGRIG